MLDDIYVIDTETTGVTSSDQVIQLAMINISNNIKELQNNYKIHLEEFAAESVSELRQHSPFFPSYKVRNNYFNPTVVINPHAQKVHGLSKIKLCKYPSANNITVPVETALIIAHNASFDTRMLKAQHIPSICTIGLAKKIEKIQGGKFGFSNYQLFTMFVFFYPDLEKQFANDRHDALVDCEMTLLVLLKLLEQFPFLQTLTEVREYFWSE